MATPVIDKPALISDKTGEKSPTYWHIRAGQ